MRLMDQVLPAPAGGPVSRGPSFIASIDKLGTVFEIVWGTRRIGCVSCNDGRVLIALAASILRDFPDQVCS